MKRLMHLKYVLHYLLLLLLTVACRPMAETESLEEPPRIVFVTVTPIPLLSIEANPPAGAVPVTVETTQRAGTDRPCTGRFAWHQLDHTTTVPGGHEVRMFEANGGGLAINDLDNDGDLDIVLANHAEPNTILWNDGDLNFRTERIAEGDARAANIVDVDGDGWLDIVFTRRASAPNYWRNEGGRQFTRTLLPGVDKPVYAINWSDLDGDNDLDFVGATYDAGLLADFGAEFLASGQAGVYLYENRAGHYQGTRLANNAQALALILPDLNGDGRPDIVVGNDFAVPDYTWLYQDGSWLATPFETTSHSTMSLDTGDVDNNGSFELFATDMMPYNNDPATAAAWAPILEAMMADPHLEDDPQIMSNVLQLETGVANFQNEAGPRGVEATGWSWSAKFGDLDQDGFLDLYVVNGFIEYTTFGHLPDHELVEENQALQNVGHGYYRPAPEWNLGSTQSGRGMSMADLDGDGDLDIVTNNLRAPAQLFENQLCTGAGLQIDLFWPNSGNSRAIGGVLALHTNRGTFYRTVKAASGYLSGDPARVHFGFPQEAELHRLEIRWPDDKSSIVENSPAETLMSKGILAVYRQ